MSELLKNLLFSVIEAAFYFLQIHREVMLRNSPIVVEKVFGITPEPLDAVNGLFCGFVDDGFTVTHGTVFTKSLERSIPPEGIDVVETSLLRAGFDVVHEGLGQDRDSTTLV